MQESRIDGNFSWPEPFDQGKMENRLQAVEVESISVFQATPTNIKFAEYRARYPGMSRKQIRRIMKRNKDL